MEPSGSEASEAQSKDKGNVPVIDVDSENVNQSVDERVSDHVDEQKKRRYKSFVWDHFPRIEGATEAKCPYCGTVLAANSKQNGTSTLGNHLINVCVTSPLYRSKDKKKQTKLSFKPATMGESGGTLVSHSFNQERCRKAVARMCIKDNQPFSIVEDEGFSELVWELNSEFELPSRWTVARDALSIYQEEAKKLKNLLKNQTVCLTTDTWTSVQNYNYMCLTAHWVDDSWKLRKKILIFCRISNHKGVTIGNLVYRCLQEWGITRVFTVTVDNASSNDGAIKKLRTFLKGPNAILDCKYTHLRCCAHIINLVVRDGLEEQHSSICKIRRAVKYLRSSSGRQESFENGVEFEKVDCKRKPCLDVDTRWNSTFLMLETAVKFEKVFDRLELTEHDYTSYFFNEPEDGEEGTRMMPKTKKKKKNVVGVPNEDDWSNARSCLNACRYFKNGRNVMKIKGRLVIYEAGMTSRTETSNQGDQVSKRLKTLSAKTIEICKIVEDALKELYVHYKIKLDKHNDETFTLSSSSTPSEDDCSMKIDLDDGFSKYLETQYGEGDDYTEVDVYLKDGAEKRGDNSFDVLEAESSGCPLIVKSRVECSGSGVGTKRCFVAEPL
ncbi:zinc finger BED domain-containing protein RICESLEEPER 2-like protein [Tanacetum coccineum]